MTLWRWLRQSDQIEDLERLLQEKISELRLISESMDSAERQLERELTRRVAAESVAEERRLEVERLIKQLEQAGENTKSLMGERLRSVDAVNMRLLAERTEAAPPDFKRTTEQAQASAIAGRTMQRIRQMEHDMDFALLAKMHPKFAQFAKSPATPASAPEGVPMNETVPTEAA